tara:strand:- start:1195 stop:1782 length:588 start_codon:yes stop_codon:yes gene_type:complete
MELLLVKKKLKLARKGHKLLKQKRDVLVMEFFSILKDIKKFRVELVDKLAAARDSLLSAQAIEGELDMERISLGLGSGLSISFSSRTIMGVHVPVIEDVKMEPSWHGYFEQTIELDNAIIKYREVFPDFIKLAEKQLVLKRLAEEIKKTKTRVNSLEYLTIPRLEKTKKIIEFKLEELERESFSRLKHIKKRAGK